MTMSISFAPAATLARISSTRCSIGLRARRKSRRHRGDRNVRSLERVDGGRHERVVHAHRADLDRRARSTPSASSEVVAQRMARLGAQAPDVARRVVAGERREVHQRDRAQQPRGLPLLLHRAPRGHRRRAALDGAAIDANRAHDVEVERHSRIALDVIRRQRPRRRDECEVGGGLGGRGHRRLLMYFRRSITVERCYRTYGADPRGALTSVTGASLAARRIGSRTRASPVTTITR